MTVCPARMGSRWQLPQACWVAAEGRSRLELGHVYPELAVSAEPCGLGHVDAMTAVLGDQPILQGNPLHAGRA
jgi:hypothetical protein